MNPLISTKEAEARIRLALKPLGIESVALADAVGRCLAEEVRCDRDLPPYSRSMMDGIALNSSSTQPPYVVEGLHAAGDPPPAPLKEGSVWEIMTGAIVPSDCDAVVPYEHLSADCTQPKQAIEAGQFIHPAGSDAREGDVLITKDTIIGPVEVAIAASVGKSQLQVLRRARIALISSGDEAVAIDAAVEPWQIRRSNAPMLESILVDAGMVPVFQQHVGDDASVTRAVLKEAMEVADVVILCGGISKGKKDFMRPVIEEALGAPAFHGVAQKPGKPLAFWAGPPLVFALPGNPVSVLATFSRYVLPALAMLEGREFKPRSLEWPEGVQSLPQLSSLLALDTQGRLLSTSNSGNFTALSGMRGFVEVPAASSPSACEYLNHYPSLLTQP